MPNSFTLTRRETLLGLAVTVGFLPGASFALTKEDATALIGKLVKDINRVINSGVSEAAMYPEFAKIFEIYGDVPIIARSVLGVAWRSATASQRTRFVSAFRDYLARKYGKRFREFIGGEIVVTGAKAVKSGYLVTSMAYLKGSTPFIVEWQVSDKSGKNKMFNLYIEGINMLASERAEIGAMLDKRRGNIDRLIADLKTAG